MSVYVDELQPTLRLTRRWRYPEYCHMMADTPEELEAMARRLGLRRAWRHHDHYDLTANKRRLALEAGAEPVTVRQMVTIRRTNALGRTSLLGDAQADSPHTQGHD